MYASYKLKSVEYFVIGFHETFSSLGYCVMWKDCVEVDQKKFCSFLLTIAARPQGKRCTSSELYVFSAIFTLFGLVRNFISFHVCTNEGVGLI